MATRAALMRSRVALLVFRLDQQLFGLPLTAVERVIRVVEITGLPKAPNVLMGVINVAGEAVPVVSLRRRLSLTERDVALSDQLILVRLRKRRIAILVDMVDGLVNCPTAAVTVRSNVFPGIDAVESFVAADDQLLLIYDIATLLSWEEEKAVDEAINETAHTTID